MALYKFLLNKFANEGDKILDTHAGSGSFLIAAHDLGFDAVAVELNELHFKDANHRIKVHQKQQSLFEPKQTFEFKQQTLL